MTAAAIDIGTNSVRLLIGSPEGEVLRRSVVTALGRGLRHTGRLSVEGRRATLDVLASYRQEMEQVDVTSVRAVLTAVGRNASNTTEFLEEAAEVLGFAPQVISGEEEAALSYAGAVADLDPGEWTVVDIGGGSTEVVTASSATSFEIGSVVLTDLHLSHRPLSDARLDEARELATSVLRVDRVPNGVVGVAGTWTSLVAMSMELDPYVPELVHHAEIPLGAVSTWVKRLARMTEEQTAGLAGLDPARAPVILGGAIVAEAVLTALGADECLVSEHDLLDGVLAELWQA